jgi:predicted nucleic-acid-binding protein
VTVEHDAIVRRAILDFEAGPADFSDYVIREVSREASASPVLTFDERFARGPDVELVPER